MQVMIASTPAVAAWMVACAAPAPAHAKNLCERPQEVPHALFDRLTKTEKLPEISRDKSYVAVDDPATGTVWTFTVPGHAAHPSVVCRRPIQAADKSMSLEMNVLCNAPEAECQKLLRAFQELNRRMIDAMKKQAK